nr:hypothetical protein [Tanacetum cinerariifolium]
DEGDDGDDDEEGDDSDDAKEGNDDDDDAQDDDDDQEEGDDEDDQEEGSNDEQASNEEGEEFLHYSLSTHDKEETRDEESFEPIPKTPENTDDEGNGRGVQMADVHTTQEFEDSHVTLTPVNLDGQQQSSSVSSQFLTSMLNLTPDARNESIFETTSQMDVQTPISVAPLPVSASTLAPLTITTITTRMNEAVKVAIQIQADRLCNEAQAENDEFLKTIDENMQKIIKEQVKEQVKVQVSKILPKIKQTVNEQLEAEVLTRSSNSWKTSYAIAADLSEMELKKILIEKMEGNKSIHRSNKQRNLNKALVKAYESDKIILDTYGDTVTLKRRKEPESASAPKEKATKSADKSTQGSKSRQTTQAVASESATAQEPMQTIHEMEEPSHTEFETGADDQLIAEPSQHPEWFSQQKKPPTPDRDWHKTLPATHGSIQPWISELAMQSDSRSSFNELMDTPVDFSAFLMNRLKVDTLTPKLLVGPTYELMKWSCKSLVKLEFFLEEVYKATTDQLDWANPEGQQYPHNLLKPLPLISNSRGCHVISFDHFINKDLDYFHGGASSCKYTTSVTKTKATDYGYIKWIEDLAPRTMESARDVYSKRRIIVVTELKIVDDGMLTNILTALDDRLKGIRMKYLPQKIWRKSDKDRAAAMIQAIDKQLKTRRIMRSLERFVGGRLYEGDFRMLQRTI